MLPNYGCDVFWVLSLGVLPGLFFVISLRIMQSEDASFLMAVLLVVLHCLIVYHKMGMFDSNIDSVSYRLVDSLQTADNRAKVGSSCAFLFKDGVYTQEHVFTEIPQAKEYYLKYCKEVDIVK